jgi:1-acyl-sn-glycerol-3-phosphate acyltransferase
MNPLYWFFHRFLRITATAFFDLTVIGAANARISGPALLACNHVSYLDPLYVGASLDEDIYFFARRSLFRFAITAWLFKYWQVIPIDRDKPEPSSMKTIFQRLEEGKKLILFPEGTRSPNGELQCGEPGVGMMIARSKVPVIPVRIFGSYEALPRDRKLPKRAKITVSFGKPWVCDLESYGKKSKDTYQRIADDVMQLIANLPRL